MMYLAVSVQRMSATDEQRCAVKTDNHDRSSFSQIKTILKRERQRADTHEMCVCVNVEQRVDARRRSCE